MPCLLTETNTQSRNIELQLVIAPDHLETNVIIRDSEHLPISPGRGRLVKQESKIPIGFYFASHSLSANKPKDNDSIYGVRVGTNFDDSSQAVCRFNIQETGNSSIEYLTLGYRDNSPVKVSFLLTTYNTMRNYLKPYLEWMIKKVSAPNSNMSFISTIR